MDQVVFKVAGWLINIDKIILFLMVVGLVILFTKWWKMGRRTLVVAISLIFMTAVLPTGFKIMSFLEDRFPVPMEVSSDVKGIILLGGSFDLYLTADRGQPCFNLAAGRIIDFATVAHKYPHLPVLFTGAGVVADPKANESTNMKNILTSFGVDLNRFTFENKSKSTIENATLSFELIKPKPEDKWLLVTSAYQMPRAVGLFRGAGWNVIPYPVDFHAPREVSWLSVNFDLSRGLLAWSTAIRELGGMGANYLAGRTTAWIAE